MGNFQTVFPESKEVLVIRLYKLCDILATSATMQVYLEKGEHCMALQLMATNATVTGLMRKIGQPQIIC
jgi:hypothetical protein